MTEEYFKRILRANGLGEYWADRLWKARDQSIINAPENEATEKLLVDRCEDWLWYQDYSR